MGRFLMLDLEDEVLRTIPLEQDEFHYKKSPLHLERTLLLTPLETQPSSSAAAKSSTHHEKVSISFPAVLADVCLFHVSYAAIICIDFPIDHRFKVF